MGILKRGKKSKDLTGGKEIKNKPISITKAKSLGKGKHLGKVESIELIEDKEITYYGKPSIKDVIEVKVNINGTIKTKNMIFTMSENSEIGKLIKAIKGYIPEEIENLEEEVVGKEVIVMIDTNTKDDYTHYNIVGFESINNESTDEEDIVAEDEDDYGDYDDENNELEEEIYEEDDEEDLYIDDLE